MNVCLHARMCMCKRAYTPSHLCKNPSVCVCVFSLAHTVIDLGSQKKDTGLRGAAVRSLEKWKRLSHTASVNALVRTLKTIKKQAVANKIEKQLDAIAS